MQHRLDPLLRPGSIAVVGASERPGSVGCLSMENLLQGGFDGALYAVNPGREAICGVPCYPALDALPQTVEHVIFAVGDHHIEQCLDEAIAHGARAATIMSSLILENDSKPDLRNRVSRKIADAGLLVCGGNGMGFYNFQDGVWASGFDTRDNHRRGGNVTLISQSGSGMCGIVDCEERIDFNLAVSTGQELSVGIADYMEFALDLDDTRVIGLFLETARDPAGLVAALQKANDKGVPVVALKVGRTRLSARLALSHSGAIAGRDEAYQALFDRYGVQRVENMDELATAMIMFAQPHPVGAGGLTTLHDSGGERQHLIDLAHTMQVPLTRITADTEKRLEELLDPGLPAVNPLDAWGAGGPDSDFIMEESLVALMSDPGAAMGAVVHDRAPMGRIYTHYRDYLRKGHAASGKPAFLVSNHQGTGSDELVVELTREGFPVLDGLRSFLAGVKCLFDYRDFIARPGAAVPLADADLCARWKKRMADTASLDEAESASMLGEFGLPVNPAIQAENADQVMAAGKELGFPLVLKTATPEILHKTDQGGVILDIRDRDALENAYRDMRDRLGSRVLVSPMLSRTGVEMMLGMVHDEQFGPLVILGFGGVNVEVIRDVVYALPPFDWRTARQLLNGLHARALLDGVRGSGPLAVDEYCKAAAQFSVMVAGLEDVLEEIDINPLIVHTHGCVAVDSLVVPRRPTVKN